MIRPKYLINFYKTVLTYLGFSNTTPLLVGFSLSERCNMECIYCPFVENELVSPKNEPISYENELTLMEIKTIIDQLKRSGSIVVAFTGGEPLLRSDFDEIVSYAASAGFKIVINTNGTLVSKKIKTLKQVMQVNLSFDGPEKIHDLLRGKGTYRTLINAIDLLKDNLIRPNLYCVVSKLNLNYMKDVVEFADKNSLSVRFTPVQQHEISKRNINDFLLDDIEYGTFISNLYDLKRIYKNTVTNTLRGITEFSKIRTAANKNCKITNIYISIRHDGSVFGCSEVMKNSYIGNLRRHTLNYLLKRSRSIKCNYCLCSTKIELKLLAQLNISALASEFRNIFNTNR